MVTERKPGKTKKWGIIVKLVDSREIAHGMAYTYRTLVSYYQKGSLFVSNPALQEKIKASGFRREKIGRIKLKVIRVPKIVYAHDFLPLGYSGGGRWGGMGMAASLELLAINDIIKRLGPEKTKLYKYLVGHHDPSDERVRMYEKMGLKVNQPVPLAEYRQILLKHIQKGVKKARAKSKPKKKKPPKKKRRK